MFSGCKMCDVCLIVIFNHRYDKNLPILESMYRDRFTHRYYIVPFYDGDMDNVIPVYGRSIFFQGYIAQAAKIFIKEEFKHYLFVADDMIIHPQINETNYREFFEVKDGQSYISELRPLHEMGTFWIGTLSAVFYFKKQKYVEVASEIPTEEIATNLLKNQGAMIRPLTRKEIFGNFSLSINSLGNKARLLLRLLTRLRHPLQNTYKLPYPMVGSYSDILLVSSNSIKKFAHYCGVFSSTCLFAEVAIPTALGLASSEKIQVEKNMKRKGRAYWQGTGPFYYSDEYQWDNIEKEYKNLDDMMNRFPDSQLFIHPVKLSKWINK